MFTCKLCQFPTELDDVVIRFPSEKVICYRCFLHEVEPPRTILRGVERDVKAASQG